MTTQALPSERQVIHAWSACLDYLVKIVTRGRLEQRRDTIAGTSRQPASRITIMSRSRRDNRGRAPICGRRVDAEPTSEPDPEPNTTLSQSKL